MSVAYLADLASLIGLGVTLVGFGATIRNVRKARKAAEEARQAARETIASLNERLFEEEITEVSRLVFEVLAACRAKDWSVAMVRCGDAQIRLARVSSHPSLVGSENDDLTIVKRDLANLSTFMDRSRRRAPNKELSIGRLEPLQAALSILGSILGRLRSKAFEY